jgi:hypothetical protein
MSAHQNNTYQAAFFIIPTYILNLPDINLGFLRVYNVIFEFWNKGLSCFLSDHAIMERTGLKKTHMYDAFAYFEKHNELVRRKVKGRRYFVQPERIIIRDLESETSFDPPEEHLRHTGGSTPGTPEQNKRSLNKENNKDLGDFSNAPKECFEIDYSKPKKKPKTQRKKSYRDDERFIRFYEAYPKKVKPQDAYMAFLSVIGNDDELLEEVIADVHVRAKNHSQWQDKQFIPYPASYLRSADWESEIYNANEEKLKKIAEQEAVAEARTAAQLAFSEKQRQMELSKPKQHSADGKAYRQLAGSISAIDFMKKQLGMPHDRERSETHAF